ncbi:LysM peptidoglycan-binding domain-containing protein [Roseomonas sp. NAR14]|uniref:LysM peptidoglycan-binding domain-containing protein n=1 Tax=Roseomonas acroporae TaxID=2937791 RepID=A0A9X1YHQ3_9PROT|nr:LysM peptidoglycan-binding domain-containing protein [Roseomonas acroporae]MCK8786361.1 LysM peptidoglycan-binding domain-containing protein [Roseomonas acroporae]
MAERTGGGRAAAGLLGAAAVLAGAMLVARLRDQPGPPVPDARPAPAAVPAPAAPPPGRDAATPIAPRLDIARVGARGTAVVAGRAGAAAEVVLLANDREIGRARADAQGLWVILPAEPLPPGAHLLSLRVHHAGGPVRSGAESAVVVVPDPPPATPGRPGDEPVRGEAPLVVLLGPDAATPSRLVQGGATAGLAVDLVDYDEAGRIRFAGSGAPNGTVRLYVDQQPAGEARTDGAGRWSLAPALAPAIGPHTLRLDQIRQDGQVAARIELPFQRDGAPPGDGQAVVQPGLSLWRIARQAYGQGTRYTVIYAANRSRIRDPDRIYTGQVLALPAPAGDAAPEAATDAVAGRRTPTASSRDR